MYIPPIVCGIIIGVVATIAVEVVIVLIDDRNRKNRKGE